TRAAGREVPPVEEARHDRRRAEHDRVDGDRGDQKKDRPPPVIRRNSHEFGIVNLEFGMRYNDGTLPTISKCQIPDSRFFTSAEAGSAPPARQAPPFGRARVR